MMSLLLKKLAKKGLHIVQAIAFLMSMMVSPPSNALEIRLGSAMNLRMVDSNELVRVGVLAVGSVVEIPDRYAVRGANGRIDSEATLQNWLTQARFSQSDISKPVTDPKLDFYFPVKVVSMARGSRGDRSLIGQTQYMALRVLDRSRGGLRVNQDSPVYAGPADDTPLQPLPAENAPAPAPAPTEAAGPCTDCRTDQPAAPAPEVQRQSEELRAAIEDEYLPQTFQEEARSNRFPGLARSFSARGANCTAFIRDDGSYGPTGEIAARELSRFDKFLDNSNGTNSVCPRFSRFSDAQKRHFWVWTMAAMAWGESTCNPRARNGRATNGVAAGLFQIEESASLRRNRDRIYGGRFCSGDPYSVEVNTRCAVRMLRNVLDRNQGPYHRSSNYWQVLRSAGSGTRTRIAQYPGCRG